MRAGTAISPCNVHRLHPAACVWGRCGLSRPLCGFLRREAGGSERRRRLPRDCSAAASVGSGAPLRMCGPLWRRRRGSLIYARSFKADRMRVSSPRPEEPEKGAASCSHAIFPVRKGSAMREACGAFCLRRGTGTRRHTFSSAGPP